MNENEKRKIVPISVTIFEDQEKWITEHQKGNFAFMLREVIDAGIDAINKTLT